MTYTLNVVVDPEDLKRLQSNGFNLCLARGVEFAGREQQGNVVSSAIRARDLTPRMQFQWDDKFQVFGAGPFRAGFKVTAHSNVANIEGGQTCILQSDRDVRISGSAQPGRPFYFDNQWGPTAIGINDLDIVNRYNTTIFVSPQVQMSTTTNLLPINKYSVFWDMNLDAETMFEHTSTPPFLFDLTRSNEITLQFKDDVWSIS